jgi:hypothetical protein
VKTTFVIITVSERVADLNKLLDSIVTQPRFDAIDINILYQGVAEGVPLIRRRDRITNLFVYPDRLGCHGARVELLNRIRYEAYINLDDDMELTEHTFYARALAKAAEPSTGFVLTNWARTRKLMDAKVPKMKDVFVKQALVYQGGGMAYTDEVADLMRALPSIPLTFDTVWPLTAYVNGFTNYRYLGSLAVHHVCTRGGMNTFMASNPPQTLMDDYVTYRRGKRCTGTGMDLLIPMDSDLTPKAREAHRQARVQRFGK